MRPKSIVAVLAAIGVTFASVSEAEIVTNLSVGGGYQGNLFNDSLSQSDSYSTFGADIRFYPSSTTEIAAISQYNAYASTEGLSNFVGNATVMVIPTKQSSAVTLALSGSLSHRTFGEIFDSYDQTDTRGSAAVNWRVAPSTLVKSRVSLFKTSYVNWNSGSNHGFQVIGGTNLSLAGSNAFDLEIGLDRRTYDQVSMMADEPPGRRVESNLISAGYSIIHCSLRYSRPLGDRTGMNVILDQRQLHQGRSNILPGFTTDVFSPWAELWEGTSISASLKRFLPQQMTIAAGAVYLEKTFVDAIEYSDVDGELYWRARDDTYVVSQISLSRQISTSCGATLKPTLRFSYTHNSSTLDLFDYSDLSGSLSLAMRF